MCEPREHAEKGVVDSHAEMRTFENAEPIVEQRDLATATAAENTAANPTIVAQAFQKALAEHETDERVVKREHVSNRREILLRFPQVVERLDPRSLLAVFASASDDVSRLTSRDSGNEWTRASKPE